MTLFVLIFALWWVGGMAFAVWAWTRCFDFELSDLFYCALICAALGPFVGALWLMQEWMERTETRVLLKRRTR